MNTRTWWITLSIVGVVSFDASADPINVSDMPPAKRAELEQRGLETWTPGQGKQPGGRAGDRPAFVRIGKGNPNSTAGRVVPNTDAIRATGTIQYDDGILTALPTVFGQIYGNRFAGDDCGGVELDTITLNNFSFYFMEDSLPDTGLFFQVSNPLNTMSINAVASTNVTGLMNSGPNFSAPVLNVVNANVLPATNGTMFTDTFFLGGWSLNSAAALPVNNEAIGLATNGPLQRGYTAASGTGAVAFGSQPFNAILRANITSPNAIPLELMPAGPSGQ